MDCHSTNNREDIKEFEVIKHPKFVYILMDFLKYKRSALNLVKGNALIGIEFTAFRMITWRTHPLAIGANPSLHFEALLTL